MVEAGLLSLKAEANVYSVPIFVRRVSIKGQETVNIDLTHDSLGRGPAPTVGTVLDGLARSFKVR